MKVLLLLMLVAGAMYCTDAAMVFRMFASICPNGLRSCHRSPCINARCPNYPSARCTYDTCGPCVAVWKDRRGNVINDCGNNY